MRRHLPIFLKYYHNGNYTNFRNKSFETLLKKNQRLYSTLSSDDFPDKKCENQNSQSSYSSNEKVNSFEQFKNEKNHVIGAEEYFQRRTQYIESLKKESKNPYPHSFEISCNLDDFNKNYEYLNKGESLKEIECRVSGRISSIRYSGKKLMFYDIIADGSKIQVVCNKKHFDIPEEFSDAFVHLRRGDVVGVRGFPKRTQSGELSLIPKSLKLLSPCLRMIPTQYFGLKDKEAIYRKRYLHLITNPESRTKLLLRTKVNKYLRSFFDDRNFDEVETPTLSYSAGGANARPFMTYHNQINDNLFMRIAPELYLKMLVIGGIQRVYEIGKTFRNEGVDKTHNPEFTVCEAYQAYSDYNDLKTLTEDLMIGLTKSICGTSKIIYTSNEGEDVVVDFQSPFTQLDMIPELEKATGKTLPQEDQLHTEEARIAIIDICDELSVECPSPKTTSRMLDKLVDTYLVSKSMNPTFIINHPKIMSPLAKDHRTRPGLTERFELFICKTEVCNAYTELNDPIIQRERFKQQAFDKAFGDEETQDFSEEFCTALEYGLPPTAGMGLGIDRLIMILSNSTSIRDVLFFPLMKSNSHGEVKDKIN